MYAQKIEITRYRFVVRLLKNGQWLYGKFTDKMKFLGKCSRKAWEEAVSIGPGFVENANIPEDNELLKEAD